MYSNLNKNTPLVNKLPIGQISSGMTELVTAFACVDASSGDPILASLVEQALRRQCLDEATFWQRIKLQARLARVIPGWENRPHVKFQE